MHKYYEVMEFNTTNTFIVCNLLSSFLSKLALQLNIQSLHKISEINNNNADILNDSRKVKQNLRSEEILHDYY